MFKYIFTHSSPILTLERGIVRSKNGRNRRYFQFYPSALWLAEQNQTRKLFWP